MFVLRSIAIIIPFDAQIIPSNWPQCPLDTTSLVFNSFLANTISYAKLTQHFLRSGISHHSKELNWEVAADPTV